MRSRRRTSVASSISTPGSSPARSSVGGTARKARRGGPTSPPPGGDGRKERARGAGRVPGGGSEEKGRGGGRPRRRGGAAYRLAELLTVVGIIRPVVSPGGQHVQGPAPR